MESANNKIKTLKSLVQISILSVIVSCLLMIFTNDQIYGLFELARSLGAMESFNY